MRLLPCKFSLCPMAHRSGIECRLAGQCQPQMVLGWQPALVLVLAPGHLIEQKAMESCLPSALSIGSNYLCSLRLSGQFGLQRTIKGYLFGLIKDGNAARVMPMRRWHQIGILLKKLYLHCNYYRLRHPFPISKVTKMTMLHMKISLSISLCFNRLLLEILIGTLMWSNLFMINCPQRQYDNSLT
jgi:hypothetical protein